MDISYQKNIPLYYQIESYLRFQIESGALKPNTKLPCERDLCRNAGVSQGTLRKALEKLDQDGLIVRKVAKGTYVKGRERQRAAPVEMRLVGFLEDLIFHSKDAVVKVLSVTTVPSTEEIAKYFGVKVGERVTQFKRVKLVDGLPIYYVVNHVLPSIGKKITRRELERTPPLELFEKRFKRHVEYIEQRIGAAKAGQEVAQHLELNVFEPILHIHLSVFDDHKNPLEVAEMFCRADRYRLIAELTKRKPFSSTLSIANNQKE